MNQPRLVLAMSLSCMLSAGSLQAQQSYQKPPKAIADILDAAPFPQVVAPHSWAGWAGRTSVVAWSNRAC